MKHGFIYLTLALVMLAGCHSQDNTAKESDNERGKSDSPEVRKYYEGGRLVKEVSFVNDVRNGICRNYYNDGRLKSTIWYENGLKEDTAKWFYPEGLLYRATPYKNDKIHGIQTKYYRSGRVQATLPYENGLRLQGLKEALPDGREVESYPSIKHTIRDLRNTDAGVVKVFTQLSNESVNVKFYRGSLKNGVFDPEKCEDITSSSGMGYIELRPDPVRGSGYIDIIAYYLTRFGNRKIITARFKLPYNDLY